MIYESLFACEIDFLGYVSQIEFIQCSQLQLQKFDKKRQFKMARVGNSEPNLPTN